MAISFGAQGSGVTGSTSLAVPYPVLPDPGELFLLSVVNKYPTNGPATPAGFTLVGQASGGAGSAGDDSGTVYMTVFAKVSDGTETGNVTVTITGGNSAVGRMARYEKDPTKNWDVAAVGAAVNAATASWSVALPSNPGIDAGDFIVAYTGINSDAYTASAHAITAAGVSAWGTVTQRNDFGTGFGNDCRFTQSEHPVTTGTASGVPTYSMTESGTAGNAPAGCVLLVRLREVAGSIAASLSSTLGDLTGAATGSLPIQGAATPTFGALVLGGSAALTIVGASAPTLGALALAATGVRTPISAVATPTLADLTASSSAVVALTATAAPTLATVVSAAAATLRIVAVAGPTLADLSSAATAQIAVVGTATPALASTTAAATAALAVKAAAALQLADATSSAAGVLPIVGAATVALQALTCAASGELELAAGTGTVAQALADLTVASVSKLSIAAAAAPTLGNLTSAAQAAVAIRGTLGVTLGAATLVAAGGVVSGEGEVDTTLAALTCSATARMAIVAASVQVLEAAALVSAGRAALVGSASITLGACTIHATGADSSTVPPVIGARRNAQRQQQVGRRPQIDAGIRRRN